jgi:hypothetical protein
MILIITVYWSIVSIVLYLLYLGITEMFNDMSEQMYEDYVSNIDLYQHHEIYNSDSIDYIVNTLSKNIIKILFNNDFYLNRYIFTTNKIIYNNICPICIEKNNSSFVNIKKCNHTFHIKCIKEWINVCINNNKKIFCPLCKVSIVSN